ncbi:hypothetical protein TNCV_172851 [Trichonephila clavipes]|nr:hypothetical protein TNCV_172851 [Trichonephila clavipes]
MVRPLSNSPNCEKCLLARLPGMFRLPKSSYSRRESSVASGLEPVTRLHQPRNRDHDYLVTASQLVYEAATAIIPKKRDRGIRVVMVANS